MNKIGKKLVLLIERYRVMDIETMRRYLQGRSRRSVFRDLKRAGYCTSYSHAGKYHTLKTIPKFDSEGFWKYVTVQGWTQHLQIGGGFGLEVGGCGG